MTLHYTNRIVYVPHYIIDLPSSNPRPFPAGGQLSFSGAGGYHRLYQPSSTALCGQTAAHMPQPVQRPASIRTVPVSPGTMALYRQLLRHMPQPPRTAVSRRNKPQLVLQLNNR